MRRSLEEIIDCARRARTTITDLAELTVLQNGPVEMRTEPVDIWSVVKGIAKRQNKLRRENCIKVEYPELFLQSGPISKGLIELLGVSSFYRFLIRMKIVTTASLRTPVVSLAGVSHSLAAQVCSLRSHGVGPSVVLRFRLLNCACRPSCG